MLRIPSRGHVVNLALDGHEEGLGRVRAVVSSQLLLRHVSKLNRLSRRSEAGRRGTVTLGVNEHAANDLVHDDHHSEDGEECRRGEPSVRRYRLHRRRVQPHFLRVLGREMALVS